MNKVTQAMAKAQEAREKAEAVARQAETKVDTLMRLVIASPATMWMLAGAGVFLLGVGFAIGRAFCT